jgi:hypothetical protein
VSGVVWVSGQRYLSALSFPIIIETSILSSSFCTVVSHTFSLHFIFRLFHFDDKARHDREDASRCGHFRVISRQRWQLQQYR